MRPWLFRTVLKYWKFLSTVIVLQIVFALLLSIQPMYFQKIVSLAIGEHSALLMKKGLKLIASLAVIYLSGTLLQAFSGYMNCLFSSHLLKDLQMGFFYKISQLPLQYFQHQSSGEFFTKFNNDVGQVQRFIANDIPTALRELITALAVTGVLLYFCPFVLTGTAISITIVASFFVLILNKVMMKYAIIQRTGWSNINRLFDETVQGIDTIKTFGTESHRVERFNKQTSDFRNISVRAGSISAAFSPGIELLSRAGSLLLVLIAYYMIAGGSLKVDTFLLFFFYTGLLQASVSSLVGLLSNIQPQIVSIRNISAFFNESPEDIASQTQSAKLNRSVPIEIKHMAFSYGKSKTLYHNASLTIPARSITVIHGPSGSGKSTLINLLLRFYTHQSGSIFLGGVPLHKFRRLELRQKIGVVTQDHFIFHETLRMNLLLAKPDAKSEELIVALKRAQLFDFMNRYPRGLEEMMDPRGKGMSGGEKQRICIARLFLKKSPIIILDEPWSNLDMHSRTILAEVLNRAKKTTTVLILTHDTLDSLEIDKVYRLDNTGQFIDST